VLSGELPLSFHSASNGRHDHVPAVFFRVRTAILSQYYLVEQFPASVAADDLWDTAGRRLLLSGLISDSPCGTN
jgi:hypothetical protein